MSLQVAGLGFRYGLRAALERVDLRLTAGEFVALIGPNGSGKSTLLRVLAGIQPPADGQARWREKSIAAMPARVRARQIAYLPQHIDVPVGYTALEVVELGRHPHGEGLGLRENAADRAAVQSALASTDATSLAERRFDTLSGGERQRVLLAAALAQGGELLLLDEPTSALDLHHQVAGMRLLRSLAASGRAVLCATHELNLAAAAADRLILLDRGRVVADGAAAQVLQSERLRQVYGEGVWVGQHPSGSGVIVLPEIRG
jgi:iron complex transport system ATP-binding protein